jgi:integrase
VTLRNGEVRWEVGYYDADRGSARRRRRFQRRDDAQTFLDETRRRRRLGELAEAEWARRTVRHLALDWWALYVLPNLSARTRRDYRKLLDRHIIPRLGSHRLCDVTVPVVDDFKAKLLAAGVGDSQTRQALAVLSGMFTYAERRDRVAKNPLRLVKKPSGRRKRAVVCPPPLSVELARALLLQKERYGDAALVCMLAYAGPRPQDALALEWRHVRERTLLFEQKNVVGEIVAGQKTGRPARTTRSGRFYATTCSHGSCARAAGTASCSPTTRASRGARPTGGTGPSACGGRCAKRLRSASRRTGCDTRTRRCGSGRARRSPSWRRSSATVHR